MAVLKLEHVYKRYDNTEKKLFKKQVKNDFHNDFITEL